MMGATSRLFLFYLEAKLTRRPALLERPEMRAFLPTTDLLCLAIWGPVRHAFKFLLMFLLTLGLPVGSLTFSIPPIPEQEELKGGSGGEPTIEILTQSQRLSSERLRCGIVRAERGSACRQAVLTRDRVPSPSIHFGLIGAGVCMRC